MTTCNHYYYCKCFILLSITSIFNFMFIILLFAMATLDRLPSSRKVLNCFHLFWLSKLYPLLGWLCRLLGWFYSFAFTFILTCITFNLYYYCIIVLPLPTPCPFHIYIYIYILVIWFWIEHISRPCLDSEKMKENEKNNPGSLNLEKDPILMSLMCWRPTLIIW